MENSESVKEISTPHPLDNFMEIFGAWEDERRDEEIIKDIYDSRSFSNSEYSF